MWNLSHRDDDVPILGPEENKDDEKPAKGFIKDRHKHAIS